MLLVSLKTQIYLSYKLFVLREKGEKRRGRGGGGDEGERERKERVRKARVETSL